MCGRQACFFRLSWVLSLPAGSLGTPPGDGRFGKYSHCPPLPPKIGTKSRLLFFRSLAILNAVAWLLIVFFMDETFYPRHLPAGQVPVRQSRILRVVGIEQWKTNLIPNTFWQAGMRSWTAITKLPVLLSCIYYFMTFAWVIAVNITIGVFVIPTYNFTFDNLGKFSFHLTEADRGPVV